MTSTALYDYRPRTAESMNLWFDVKEKGRFPVIGVEAEDGALAGFASYGTFRAHPAYKYTIEHSVYVDRRHRGRGIGRFLLTEIIAEAKRQEYHTMIGVIDAQNAVSIALHRALGFEPAGTIRQAGYKFGRWLDVVFYQLILPTPNRPTEG